MLLEILDASLLGNMLAAKGIIRAGYGSKGKRIIRAGYGCKKELFHLILYQILKYKSIIRMNIDLMEFILGIIYTIK